MQIQAFAQPRPLPDRLYAKAEQAEFSTHADSYVQAREENRSQAMARGFVVAGAASTALSFPGLWLAGHALGVPSEAALVGAGLGSAVIGLCLGAHGGIKAGDRAVAEFDGQNARPVLTAEKWDTYVDPYHNFLTLDHLRS